MLKSLSIKNYALIDELSIDFSDGLSIITGETGAGKSILLGALGLVLGNRADISSLKDTANKCVIEATLDIAGYKLQTLFEELDLDYEPETILRREILHSGKSRAFVNDTPTTLSVISQLKNRLIDIHSQHQTLALADNNYQFSLVDSLANNEQKLASYKRGLQHYNLSKKELAQLLEQHKEANQQYDYNLHLFTELEEAKLKDGEQEELEEKLEKINNVEEIKINLSEALQVATEENIGIQTLLHSLENSIKKVANFSKTYQELYNRISSTKIELDDVIRELETEVENVDFNPNEAEELNDRLQLIYSLQKKHAVSTISELLVVFEDLSNKVATVENAEEELATKQKEIDEIAEKLDVLAKSISDNRVSVIPKLKQDLETLLSDLGMPQATFKINIEFGKEYFSNGKDTLSFLLSANKGTSYGELKKVASGGELSRIMLAIKKVLSENSQLPTIIFDEIDTGVSGEISNKMASIMQKMSQKMQVITITHLPQIAGKGNQHYKVFKEETNNVTNTKLKKLSAEERIVEIAEMLSGKNISDSAITHAKELLN